jgi:DNA-directed RNA polymerase subunit M/transcription elongation factor TFIIS
MENSTDKKEAPAVEKSPETAEALELRGRPEASGDSEPPRSPLAGEPASIPPDLKLRLEKCPKCLYERQSGDNAFASPFECPKCGVVYALAMEEVRRKGRGQELQDEAEAEEMRRQAQAQDENIRSSQIGSAMFVGEEGNKIWIVLVVSRSWFWARFFSFEHSSP